jgi:cyclohexyl-isocyanide hydratase
MTDLLRVGMLLYPRLTQLDLTGPFEIFTRMTNTRVDLLWKTLDPVVADSGLAILPTQTLAGAGQIDVLFVPGGPGQVAIMSDRTVLDFVAERGSNAQYVTSVCTGSLILAAAGLLNGYRAACHWNAREHLALFDVVVSPERVVVDRNRITGGGVTAGIDFALLVCARVRDEHEAKRIQLQIEYDPAPPFNAGSPETAGIELTAEIRARSAAFREERRVSALEALKSRDIGSNA